MRREAAGSAFGPLSRADGTHPASDTAAEHDVGRWRGPGCRPLTGTPHRTSVTAHRPRPVLSGRAPRDGVPAPVPVRTEHLLGVVVNWPSVGLTDQFCAPCWSVRRIPTHGSLTPCGN